MADPNADLMTGSGFGTATLDGTDSGFAGGASTDAAVLDAEAAVEAARAGNAPEERLAELEKELRTARDRAAGHKGEATQAKQRATELERENDRLRQQFEANQARLEALEQRLQKREAEVADVESRTQQQRYFQDRVVYWQNEGYADDLARQYATADLNLAQQYQRVQADAARLEQEKITIAQQKQEAQLEKVISDEIREAIADAKDEGLTIRIALTDAKEAILKKFQGKRFNERDIAREVARMARLAAKDAESNGAKEARRATRAANRDRALAEGPEFEDGGTAGLSFDELEERFASGDMSVLKQYEAALKKRGFA